VSHLRRSRSLFHVFPALPDWANFCRASGASDDYAEEAFRIRSEGAKAAIGDYVGVETATYKATAKAKGGSLVQKVLLQELDHDVELIILILLLLIAVTFVFRQDVPYGRPLLLEAGDDLV